MTRGASAARWASIKIQSVSSMAGLATSTAQLTGFALATGCIQAGIRSADMSVTDRNMKGSTANWPTAIIV